ncbi:MAG: copper resistance CopC/CopD family protein [Gemmatimonadaceae bacterium]
MIGKWMTAVVALSLAAPAVLSAHPALRRAVPARGAHLSAAPRELRLTFAPSPELAFSRLQLLGPDGAPIALGPVRMDSVGTLAAHIDGGLNAGTYTVVWLVAGADGHPVGGRYNFTIAPGAAGLGIPTPPADAVTSADSIAREPGGVVPAPGQEGPPAAHHHDPTSMPEEQGLDAESPTYVAIRWAQFTALLIAIGALAFRGLVLSRVGRMRSSEAGSSSMLTVAGDRAATLGLWATAALGVVALLRLYVQSYAMHGPSDALDVELIGAILSATMWGRGWLLQVAGVGLAAAGFSMASRGRLAGWPVAAAGVIALAFTPALSGHAAASPELRPAAILADAVHVVGAGGWLGSLLFVVGVGVPAALRLPEGARGPAVADLVNAFSPTALIFAGVTGATGVFAAWLHVGSVPALWQTAYGRTLLVKLAVLSVVVGIGAYNWLRVRPALSDVKGAHRIRRSGGVELAVGVLVLAVTAVLVATPPAVDATTVDATTRMPGRSAATPVSAAAVAGAQRQAQGQATPCEHRGPAGSARRPCGQ